MGHGTSFGLSNGDADGTVSTHGNRSATAGHKGASHHGHALSARSRSSHLTAAQHARGHHLNHALAHNRFARFSTAARQVTITRDVDTAAEKALPPGIELNVDRGKAVPPGIESKVGPITRDVDTAAEKALPPGIELNADRGKAVPPGIESKVGPITPDVDTPAEKALPPGIELNVDRGKFPAPETVAPDDDVEQTEPASDDSRQR
jgi:hypothetical protein